LPAQIDNRILFTQEVDVRIIHPPFERQEQTTQESDHETDGWLLFSRKTATTPQFYLYGKRILDLGISSICLVLFLPVFLVIAVTVRVSSNGPALFIQKRVGLGGTPFRMYKFRSMICSAEKYEHSPVSPDDPRITRVGRFLRRTSLDELPQLLNVFLGHMSLVGPRPEMPYIVSGYNNHQRMRLQVIPGITGLWQLSKDRAYPIHEHLHHDLSYISQRSLPLDIAILIHTLLFAMHGGI
jgi:lipopolysaccharide/colanic/teichoic acid biosynthesis glycosyltransferase